MSGVSPLRRKFDVHGRSQSGIEGKSLGQGLSGGSALMCFVPHAKNRGAWDSFPIHRSPHQDRARRRTVSKLKVTPLQFRQVRTRPSQGLIVKRPQLHARLFAFYTETPRSYSPGSTSTTN